MPTQNVLKNWLSEFLFTRAHFKGPVSRKPLFSYHVSPEEYKQLESLLRQSNHTALQPLHTTHWSAGFCLFVSEWFRREYDGDWSWNEVESRLKIQFSSTQRSHLLENGLVGYWGRSIRKRDEYGTRDLLGSLFAEGGLPWQLVQSESHSFGRTVRRGLRNHYRTERGLRTTVDIISGSEHHLPQAFSNLETMQILAGIVDQLMLLAKKFDIQEQNDPVSFLDKKSPDWRSAFPVPLDEKNAQSLINDWLKDAGQRHQERQKTIENEKAFTCQHKLQGALTQWSINSELYLPRQVSIPFIESLTSTRFELGFFEGEHLLAKGGAVYAQKDENGLKIRFQDTLINLRRRQVELPVVLKLIDSGRVVHIFNFDNSALDLKSNPLFFEPRDDEWWLAAQASCKITSSKARVRLPFASAIISGTPELIAERAGEEKWFETTEDLRISIASDLYRLSLRSQPDSSLQPYLTGKVTLFESRSNTVFAGFPELTLPESYPYKLQDLHHWVSNEKIENIHSYSKAGTVPYSIKNQLGETILQRRISTLPKGFYLSAFPAVGDQPAKIRVHNGSDLILQVIGDDISYREEKTEQQHYITLNHTGDTIPTRFRLEVSSDRRTEPVELILPYPYQGARIINSEGIQIQDHDLTLAELLGTQLFLFSGQPQGQTFHLNMQLVVSNGKHNSAEKLTRHYSFQVGQEPLPLSLFSFQSDMAQLLGAVDDQDAFIRLTVDSTLSLLRLNIRRYSGYIKWQSNNTFAVYDHNSHIISEPAKVEAMLLPDPKQKPVEIHQQDSEGVGTGYYETPSIMDKSGPWLIYPCSESSIQFRPKLHVSGVDVNIAEKLTEARSLHHATQLYHPKENPNIIDSQVEEMGQDLTHSGWHYLDDLKTNFGHLPLSVFETWLSISKNPKALAAAIFRLQLDERFCTRIKDELAVIWESIPLSVWHESYNLSKTWYEQLGLGDEFLGKWLKNRRDVLLVVVPGFEHLGDFIATGKKESLQRTPPLEAVLPYWHQELRQQHSSDNQWPTALGVELRAWVQHQDLPDTVKLLSNMTYTHAATLLPIFMAQVTAGKTSLSSLFSDETYLKYYIRNISDFDRSNWYTPVHALMVSYLLAKDL